MITGQEAESVTGVDTGNTGNLALPPKQEVSMYEFEAADLYLKMSIATLAPECEVIYD